MHIYKKVILKFASYLKYKGYIMPKLEFCVCPIVITRRLSLTNELGLSLYLFVPFGNTHMFVYLHQKDISIRRLGKK